MTFEYAPAPESRSVVDIAPSLRPVHRRRVRRGGRRQGLQDGQPVHGGGPLRDRPGGRGGRGPRGEGSPQGVREVVGAAGRGAREVPVPDRADHPGAQPRARGPGDARQRQADQGDARRGPPAGGGALLLLRGLGGQARPRGLRPEPGAAGRRGPGHPVELPAADAGVEDRPGAGDGQHGRPEAGRDDPAVRALLRGHLPPGGPAQGCGEHPPGLRRRGRGAHGAPRREQGGVHRLHRGGQGDRPPGGGHATRRSRSNWAARARTSSSTTRPSTRRSRASSRASSSTRARSAARARASWSRSRWPTRCWTR